jgi:uncharacterized protein YijF (DUF1287 family)
MKTKIRKSQRRRKLRYDLIIISFLILAAFQLLSLKTFYKETKFEIPTNLFKSSIKFPISENVVGKETIIENFIVEESSTDITNNTEISTESTLENNQDVFELSSDQKKIVLRLMELLDEDIEYKYQYYPDTGYPNDKYWISTDVISIVLRDSGYDLMELVYKDMSEHPDLYPMDKKGSENLDKKNDFRVVYFQQKFFQRNALELPKNFDPSDPTNLLQWQPGDIVYFEIDPENPGKDIAGMISNNKSTDGIPLVVMITGDLGKISEVDVLSEMKVSGHYRYPYPESNQ